MFQGKADASGKSKEQQKIIAKMIYLGLLALIVAIVVAVMQQAVTVKLKCRRHVATIRWKIIKPDVHMVTDYVKIVAIDP